MSGASYTRRYARQLLLTEIAEDGQARLCATRAGVPRALDARVAAVACDYLERAGLAVGDERERGTQAGARVELAAFDAEAVRALAGRAELEPAAAALAGAFAAVEAIKEALALGARASLPGGLSLAAEVP
jgi:hypothetical protein